MAVRSALPLRVLKAVLSLLLALLMAALCYVAVILTMPDREADAPRPTEQPLLAASPALSVREEDRLRELAAGFPAPFLGLLPGNAVFVSGTAADTAFEGGLARVITLRYETPDGQPLTLETFCPARALALLETEGWTLTGKGDALCSYPSVRMERPGRIRLHAQADSALYALTAPDLPEETLSALLRCLTLLEAE